MNAALAVDGLDAMTACPTPDKVTYPNGALAWRAWRQMTTGALRRRALRRHRDDIQAHLVVYRCTCGGWHCGHQKRGPRS